MSDTNTAFSAEDQTLLAEIEPHSFWFNHRNDVIAAVVARFPPPGPIYDVGGGNGYVSVALRKAGFDCIVVEPSDTGAANAARRGFKVIQASLTSLPEDLQSVAMFDVLEHVEDDAPTLAMIYRKMHPGSRLYISVPAYQALWSHDDIEAGHFRRYTLRHLRTRLECSGFRVEYGTYFFTCLIAPVLLLRVFSRRKKNKTMADIVADHTLPKGAIGNLVRHNLAHELAAISAGRSRAVGTSCLVVAHKSVA